jgi:nucleoside-diphosphate-sugar epimerase
MKILITGSEVYIESNLALALQEQTHDGLGLDPFLIFVTHL